MGVLDKKAVRRQEPSAGRRGGVRGPAEPHRCCTPPPACPSSRKQGVLEHITVNNFPIGRNVDEALRTLQVKCDFG